jgi:hypothetical protein
MDGEVGSPHGIGPDLNCHVACRQSHSVDRLTRRSIQGSSSDELIRRGDIV